MDVWWFNTALPWQRIDDRSRAPPPFAARPVKADKVVEQVDGGYKGAKACIFYFDIILQGIRYRMKLILLNLLTAHHQHHVTLFVNIYSVSEIYEIITFEWLNVQIMDVVSGDLFNILRVKPGEDLEDIYDGSFVYRVSLYYRSTWATLAWLAIQQVSVI